MGTADDMAGRVAELWRSQGEGFLERHHSVLLDDVARLRGSVVIGGETDADPGPATDWQHKMASAVHRMREWDEAVVERLRRSRAEELVGQAEWEAARKPGAVVDLTGAEPVVVVPTAEELAITCKHCHEQFDPERLVYPHGTSKPPLCLDCAREIAGFRPRARQYYR